MSAQWWLIPRARAERSTPSRLVARVQFCQQTGVLRRAGARVKTGSIFDTSHLGHTLTETALSRCELRAPKAGRKSLLFRVGHDSSPICLQPSASPLAIRSYFLRKWTDTRESGRGAEGELEYPGGVRGVPGNCGTVEKRLKGVSAYIPGGTSRRESSVEKPRLNCSR